MNRYGAVEIGFGCAHSHGDGETLNQLVGGDSEHVQADDLLLGTYRDELDGARAPALGERVIEIREARRKHAYAVAPTLARFVFGEAHRSDGRVTEDHCRNVFVIETRVGLLS